MSAPTFLPSPSLGSLSSLSHSRKNDPAHLLWYGGVAVGVLAGAALSTFLWRRRLHSVEGALSPLERAEALIAKCERKLSTIEQSVADLKEMKSDLQAEQSSTKTDVCKPEGSKPEASRLEAPTLDASLNSHNAHNN